MQFLNDAFLIHELKAYSYKLKERSTARRKTYACDLGMMKAMWSKPTNDLGAKFETQIFLELLACNKEVYYLNGNSQEVDLCIVRAGKPAELVQACYEMSNIKTRERELRALIALGRTYKVKKLVVVTRDLDEEIKHEGQTIEAIPAYRYLLTC